MTKEEKSLLAAFLDRAGDYLGAGYRSASEEYAFTGDTAGETGARGSVAPGGPEESAARESGEALFGEPAPPDSLEGIAADIARCTACGLCGVRTNTVPGEGSPRPLVLVVGEGPGADEDASGRPFVGRAGQLLDRILDSQGKIGLSRRNNCFIANVVKCRPPGNRNPLPGEISACIPFLTRQIALLRPLLILAAGNTAARTLLGTDEGITKLRGRFSLYKGGGTPAESGGIPLLPTFHPSALLRDEGLKVPVWEDMKTLRAKLCELDGDYAALMQERPL
ncbi:MAG: uracil-DNA glycosylase [Treponema sp.]|nr:uracil-DNA glycosylase [Treponema sp.]